MPSCEMLGLCGQESCNPAGPTCLAPGKALDSNMEKPIPPNHRMKAWRAYRLPSSQDHHTDGHLFIFFCPWTVADLAPEVLAPTDFNATTSYMKGLDLAIHRSSCKSHFHSQACFVPLSCNTTSSIFWDCIFGLALKASMDGYDLNSKAFVR